VTNPSSPKLENIVVSMGSTIFKNYVYLVQSISYITDYGLVFEDQQKENFYKTKLYSVDLSLSNENLATSGSNVGFILFRNAETVGFYNRSFIKGQAVLANIGGVIKCIMVIAKFISNFWNRRMSYLNIFNKVFEFDKESIYKNSIKENKSSMIEISKPVGLISTFTNLKVNNLNENKYSTNTDHPMLYSFYIFHKLDTFYL
jgi:hypothetical protein